MTHLRSNHGFSSLPHQPPPQAHARGARRTLDAAWRHYLEQTGQTGDGAELAGIEELRRGAEEFNTGRYFESHETWEVAWGRAEYPGRLFLLGLTKLGAGFAHLERGNMRGARHCLGEGLACLASFPAAYARMDTAELRQAAQQALERGQAETSAPRVRLLGTGSGAGG